MTHSSQRTACSSQLYSTLNFKLLNIKHLPRNFNKKKRVSSAGAVFFAQNNYMGKHLFTGMVVMSVLAAACSSSKKTVKQSGQDVIPDQPPVTIVHKANAAITIDGDINEWNVAPAFEDHSTGITASLQADSSHLYIAIHIMNQAAQYKMLRNGLDVYLDTSTTKKQNILISYPVAAQYNDMPGAAPADNASANTNPKKALIQKATIMQTRGLLNFRDGMHLKKNENGPSAVIAEDGNNNLVYEAAVPLREIMGEGFHFTGSNPLRIGLGFRIHGFVKTTGDDKSEQTFSGSEDGFGGRSRARRNPAFGSNNMAAYNGDLVNIHKDVLFWVKANVE